MRSFFTLLAILIAGFVIWQFPSWNAARLQLNVAEQRVDKMIANSTNNLSFSDLTELRRLPSNIKNAQGLVYLTLRGTNIRDLSGLEGLPLLQNLDLNHTWVSDLTPLSGLPSLQLLYLHNTWVEDLSPLVSLPALERLDIGQTQIATLEPITRMPQLNWLNLYRSYALDGSRQYFDVLAERISELSGGNSYRQGYRPGKQYQLKVRYLRLREMLGIPVDSA